MVRRLGMIAAVVLMLAGAGTTTPLTTPATAYSREGLPVEQLDVPSAAMGRSIRV
jgi:diacylglycerol O-acyltransferase/trehalose O-mycolyltransferase